jgi:HD-like signal output (HDOD) protein
MRREEPDYTVLERVISLDVGVAASLIKIAKSPLFGNAAANVRTVKDALQILGLRVVATAIAGLSLRKAFSKVPNLERFWDASACVAQISAWLASQIVVPQRPIRPDEVYTYGLFRDAGIPVLLSNFSDYFETLDLANVEAELPFTTIEDQEYGVNHAFIGAKLAKEWALPGEHRDAIEFHHQVAVIQGRGEVRIPDVSRYYIAMGQLAEYFHQRATLKSQSLEWDKLGDACLELLHLSPERVSEMYDQMIADEVPLYPEF